MTMTHFKKEWNDSKSTGVTISRLDRLVQAAIADIEPECRKIKKVLFEYKPRKNEESENIARLPIRIGLWVIGVFCGVFGLWALLAPLDSAAVAMGTVVLDTSRKTVQHLEGGIVASVDVIEGDQVEKDQVLIQLQDTSTKANVNVLKQQLVALQAKKARLTAEKESLPRVDFSSHITQTLDDELETEKVLDGEAKQFMIRRQFLDGKISVFAKKIQQLEKERQGIRSQEKSSQKQLVMAKQDAKDLVGLFKKGYVSKPELDDAKKREAELEGNLGSYQSNIAKVNQTIAETELEIINMNTQWANEIVAELQDVQVKASDIDERLKAAQDQLERGKIRAPRSGKVTGLKIHTVGGVISPGSPLLDIVPQDEKLVIEARVNPNDIDVVQNGQKAKVRLSAFKAKKVPMLDGVVTNVSGDLFTDEVTGMAYYAVRVQLDGKALKKLKDVKLHPGMPAEVYLVSGTRTLFKYMMSPVTDVTQRAFRED